MTITKAESTWRGLHAKSANNIIEGVRERVEGQEQKAAGIKSWCNDSHIAAEGERMQKELSVKENGESSKDAQWVESQDTSSGKE